MEFYLQFGSASNRPMQTVKVEGREKPLWWQLRGLSYTASGYGRRIPTQYQVKHNGRWRRVYCCQISNAGSTYIGSSRKWEAVVSIYK